MLNNIIAIIAICFIVVGGLWGIGNVLNPNKEDNSKFSNGVVLIAQNNAFNKTNPDIIVEKNVPKKIKIINKDFVKHDFIVDELNVNTAYLSTEQSFTTAIASKNSSTFQYYCSLHPQMRGNIIIK